MGLPAKIICKLLEFKHGYTYLKRAFPCESAKRSRHVGASPTRRSDALEARHKHSHRTDDIQKVPGMEAQVDVITGKRTILSYVTAPITATLQEAFTEQ